MPFSRIVLVRQHFPDHSLRDIPGEARRELAGAGFAARLRPGARVAIGVGSRGIANIAAIVRAVVDFWKDAGMEPFIFPAMGSHGAATAEGQADVLAHYGIDQARMGCPVISSLEVVSLGRTPEGIDTVMDRHAYSSDGVMLVGRVKWHTNFEGQIESGLFKMMAIGLGKFAGAQRYHTYGYRMGLERVIRSVGREVLRSGKILGGLAILEDANHNTAKLEAVPVETMERREEDLLELAKSWRGRIPVRKLDILVVDEIGKDISGTGLDTKVINRSIQCHYNPWPDLPVIHRIFVRDLSEATYNNGIGIGMADVVTDRLVNRVDWEATNVNSLTASTPTAIRTPIHFPTDRECLEKIATTVGRIEQAEVTLGWIRNTMELSLLAFSESLQDELKQNPNLEILGEPRDLEFDGEANLVSPLAGASPGVH
ncbi:MAG: hypothetical protein ABSD27_03640 [Bryobacteraceae bacterium]|jgi:hypothetical protein